MEFIGIVSMAIIVEGLISYIGMIITPEKKINWQTIVAIIIGIGISISYNLDLLNMFGLSTSILYVGNILTGILLSRGSNYLFDLMKILNNQKDVYKKEF